MKLESANYLSPTRVSVNHPGERRVKKRERLHTGETHRFAHTFVSSLFNVVLLERRSGHQICTIDCLKKEKRWLSHAKLKLAKSVYMLCTPCTLAPNAYRRVTGRARYKNKLQLSKVLMLHYLKC